MSGDYTRVPTDSTMDPAYPPGDSRPIGFEMHQNPGAQPQPVAVGFEAMQTPNDAALYPNLDNRPASETPSPSHVQPSIDYMPPEKGGLEEISVENGNGTKKLLEEPIEGPTSVNNTEGLLSDLFEDNSKDDPHTLFFRDGKRRIDYVLAYKDGTGSSEEKKQEKRETFVSNLEDEGLELEYEDKKNSQDGKTHFIKIHAPWEVLSRYAELMRIKMPIETNDLDIEFGECCSKCPNPFDWDEDTIKPEANYFTAPFNRSREKMGFFVIEDKETFFTNAQRSRMVHEVLMRTQYEDSKSKIGIDRLMSKGSFSAAYPLHDGKYNSDHSIITRGAENDRHLLYETWARPRVWYKYQPLDLVRNYFGEKVAIYFSWLGFYTTMLMPASVVGVAVFLYGCFTLLSNVPSNEICDGSAGNITMCPLCDERCYYWKLATSCLYSRATYLFDNPATVFFAGFMALWATVFLEFWKRKQAEIEYDWDVADFEFEEHLRPEFEATVTSTRLNPVTKQEEPYVPFLSKACRRLTSLIVILFMICLVLAALLAVIIYRIVIVAVFYATGFSYIQENAKLATTATAAVINLIMIVILNRVYSFIALALTNMEKPRTDSEFENSFTIKMFCFQFVNFYATIFYIAFFKGSFKGRPGAYDYSFIYRQEECDPAGCLIELCIQLGIVMVGKQIFNNFKEIIIPKVRNWCSSRAAKKAANEENVYTRWERDNDLTPPPPMGLFDEYLEMVIQYGFVTIFVAAFPLAPLFALINNIIEIRIDATKFVCEWRRAPALKAQDIGIWFGILQGLTFIAVLVNAFIIAITSDFIPKMVYRFGNELALRGPGFNPNNTDLTGYISWTLSKFDVNDFQNQSRPSFDHPSASKPPFNGEVVTDCFYRDFRGDDYKHTLTYWYVFAVRLAFVIVFEHAVFFITWVIMYMIPDIPEDVHLMMLRENYLSKEAIYNTERDKSREEREEKKAFENKQD